VTNEEGRKVTQNQPRYETNTAFEKTIVEFIKNYIK